MVQVQNKFKLFEDIFIQTLAYTLLLTLYVVRLTRHSVGKNNNKTPFRDVIKRIYHGL